MCRHWSNWASNDVISLGIKREKKNTKTMSGQTSHESFETNVIFSLASMWLFCVPGMRTEKNDKANGLLRCPMNVMCIQISQITVLCYNGHSIWHTTTIFTCSAEGEKTAYTLLQVSVCFEATFWICLIALRFKCAKVFHLKRHNSLAFKVYILRKLWNIGCYG